MHSYEYKYLLLGIALLSWYWNLQKIPKYVQRYLSWLAHKNLYYKILFYRVCHLEVLEWKLFVNSNNKFCSISRKKSLKISHIFTKKMKGLFTWKHFFRLHDKARGIEIHSTASLTRFGWSIAHASLKKNIKN